MLNPPANSRERFNGTLISRAKVRRIEKLTVSKVAVSAGIPPQLPELAVQRTWPDRSGRSQFDPERTLRSPNILSTMSPGVFQVWGLDSYIAAF